MNTKMFGRQIAASRALLNVSQSEFAEIAGVSRPTVSALERGTQNITLSTAAKMLEALRRRGITLGVDPLDPEDSLVIDVDLSLID